MKYRGIYEMLNRRQADDPAEGNIINYGSAMRDETPQEMYSAWYWPNYGKKYVEQKQKAKRTARI